MGRRFSSRTILDPHERKGDNVGSRTDESPPVAQSSPELREKTLAKWGHLLD